MLTDTHAHINLSAFKNDAPEVLQRCFEGGIVVVNVGTDIATSSRAVEMLDWKDKFTSPVPSLERRGTGSMLYAAVGLHPSHTYDNPYLDENESSKSIGREVFDYQAYKKLALRPRVVGIGECGLDYYRLPGFVIPTPDTSVGVVETGMTNSVELIKQQQREAFLQQIKLAQELDKALVIHCRPSAGTTDAYDDVLEMLFLPPSSPTRLGIQDKSNDLDSRFHGNDAGGARFEIHSFTGSWEIAQKFLGIGGYLGFNGIITFDKTGVLAEVVKNAPLDRILLETDSPYLAPAPYRGKRNEPLYVEYVARKIAEIKNISFEEVAEVTSANAGQLLRL